MWIKYEKSFFFCVHIKNIIISNDFILTYKFEKIVIRIFFVQNKKKKSNNRRTMKIQKNEAVFEPSIFLRSHFHIYISEITLSAIIGE